MLLRVCFKEINMPTGFKWKFEELTKFPSVGFEFLLIVAEAKRKGQGTRFRGIC